MSEIDDTAVPSAVEPGTQADPVGSPPFAYSWDFSHGLGPWTTWLPPSVITEPGGEVEQFTRLQAPGALDANHIDGVGAIWLVAHLSTPTLGSPGALNLTDATFEMTVRGTDFDINGGKLALWVCRYVPETGLLENFYVGLQVTNWANTGGDMAGQITDEWTTVTLQVSSDPADWTYAGNYHSSDGEWADRYAPFDLAQSLAHVDATLHLVVLNEDPDQAPSGFLDLADITLRTWTPAVPDGLGGTDPEAHYGLEDQVATGTLEGGLLPGTFALVPGSETNGTVTIDPDTGAFAFTAPADYYGPTDYVGPATFQYTVDSGLGPSEPITVIVYIGGINDAPELSTVDEAMDVEAGQAFHFTLFKGSDVDGDQLTFEIVPDSVVGGTVDLDSATGRYVFTPTAGFTGAASFRYRVSDGHVDSAGKTVALTVHPAGQAPAPLDFVQAEQLLIAGDVEGWTSAVVRLADAGDPNAAYHYGTWLNDGINGITLDRTLARHYLEMAEDVVPDANLQLASLYTAGLGGERDYVRARELLEALPTDVVAVYRLAVLDDLGLGAPADKARAVEGYLQASKMGSAEAAYTLGRRYLSGEGVAVSPEDAYFWLGVGLKFDAQPNYPQFRDLLAFNMAQAAESLTAGQTAALDAMIDAWTPGQPSPVNDAPVPGGTDDVPLQPAPGDPVTGQLAPGTDADGDRLTFRLVDGSVQNGSVVIDPDTGAFVFTPTVRYTGPAAFAYVVTDGEADTEVQTIQFQVEAGTAAAADLGGVDEDAVLTVGAGAGLLANDFAAPSGGAIAVTAVEGVPANVGQAVAGAWGSLVVLADGSYVYTPSAQALTLLQGQSVVDQFAYTITDEDGRSSTAVLSITVDGQDGTVMQGSGVLTGSAFADVITGGSGQDVILGLDGDDRLAGAPGAADELYGGRGDDVYVVVSAGDSIVELAGEGYDTVETTAANIALAANVEALIYTGSGPFVGTGNVLGNLIAGGEGTDVLIGLGGNDVLRGGAGAANELYGGEGDDTYVVEVAGDSIVEVAAQGTDTVQTALAAYVLTASQVENLTYTGSGGFTGAGNARANVLTGGSGDDVLAGGGGADSLVGGAGSDTADYAAAAAAVDVRLNGAVARNDGDGAADALSGIENVVGSAFDDLLIGDAGGNVLTGGLGRDTLLGMDGDDVMAGGAGLSNTLQGGRGDDLYVVGAVGDSAYELAGEGTDTVETALAAFKLSANVEDLTYTGSASFFGQGNGEANVIHGGSARDVLMGWDGNDVIVGGDGAADELYGGRGDDTFVVDGAGDTIVELVGEGFDTVLTTLSSYTLRLNVEAVTYAGTGAFAGTGTVEDNVLAGGAGDDALAGRGGDDQLAGGAGTDAASYAAAAAGVDVRLNGGVARNDGDGGTDVLSGIENLVGSAFDDLLIGDAGANALSGGLGRDVLLGMGGNDVLIGGSGVANQLQGGQGDDTYVLAVADTVVELAGEGTDAVQTTLSAYTLGAHLENLTYTGPGAFAGTGNGLGNVLTGGSANDTLRGAAGDDVLHGGGGTDTALFSGLQSEYLVEAVDGGWRVTDLVAGRDGVDLLYGVESVRFGSGGPVSPGSLAVGAALEVLAKDAGPQVQPDWLQRLHEGHAPVDPQEGLAGPAAPDGWDGL